MMERPAAARKSEEALARPVRNWAARSSTSTPRPERFHLGIGGKIFRAVMIFETGHYASSVLDSDLSCKCAERRLMVNGPELYFPERRNDLGSLRGSNQLLGIGASGLRNDGRGG